MGSSKKHKKHKDKDREKRQPEEVTPSSDQRPLKLVLKVGSTSTTVDRPVPSPRNQANPQMEVVQEQAPKLTLAYDPISGEMTSSTSGSKQHKKKKSKKKHRKHSHHSHHSHHHHHHHRHKSSCSHHAKSSSVNVTPLIPDLPAETDVNMPDIQPPKFEPLCPMEITNEEPMELDNTFPVEVPLNVPRSPPKAASLKSMSKTSYIQFLTYLLKQLQRRDSQEFFAWPVTDMIAPLYSSVIQHPMDLSTIKRKIDQRAYENISEMKADVKLMCDNAMTYNQPETIYYKAARKLWHFAKEKVFSREALADAQKMCVTISLEQQDPSPDQVGGTQIVPDLSVVSELDISTDDSNHGADDMVEPNFDLVYESEMTPEQILEQARRAAAGAAERLSLAKPAGAHFSILRQRPDGSTSLGIVGSDPGPERIMRLEDLVGKLTEGLPYLQPYKEPEKNRVHLVESIEIPPFASYLPSIDSCKANISREESALLLATYGDDELATQYAQSLLQFAGDSEYISTMADSLLDVLTQGQHSKGLAQLKDLQNKVQEEDESKKSEEDEKKDGNEVKESDGADEGLEETAEIISKLSDVQNKRLSSSTKPTIPESEEADLASTLTSKLTALISNFAPPADVTDIRSIRRSMGIVLKGDV